MQQTFQAVFESDKHTERGDLGDLSTDVLAGLVTVRNVTVPWIFVHLLESQSDSASIGIDGQNSALKLLAFFKHLVGMGDFSSPRHVAYMQQSVDSLFQFDERTVVGQVSDFTFDDTVDWVTLGNMLPRVVLGLFHAK